MLHTIRQHVSLLQPLWKGFDGGTLMVALKQYFDHGLGHGLGLDIHEGTRLAKDNKKILKSGMTVTVEPGIYIPRTGGVRIEDMVLVRPRGCEVLTRTPKNLLCL